MRAVNDLESALSSHFGRAVASSRAVGGGCIHDARQVVLEDGLQLFVKSAPVSQAAMLDAEERGLALLAEGIRVPRKIASGTTSFGIRWLALEWLELRPLGAAESWQDLGRQLAALHRITSPVHGLDHPNFIGSTPQQNTPAADWAEFYRESRLGPQLERAKRYGIENRRVLELADQVLANHRPLPALLHGDLWSGNISALPDGSAVVYDPAVYFGDAETDLAMLELFGGPIPEAFFAGYGPVAEDRQRRCPLYDLYHALNHLNLFGSGYLAMVNSCLEKLRRHAG